MPNISKNISKKYIVKWKHKIVIFLVLLSVGPAVFIGLNMRSKTKEEITQFINSEISLTADKVSSDINNFFVEHLQKQYLIKKSIENDKLNIDQKISLMISSVSMIDEVISSSIVFKEGDSYSIAVKSDKEKMAGKSIAEIEELRKIISSPLVYSKNLLNSNERFGEPFYIASIKQWFIISQMNLVINGTPPAKLLSIISLEKLQNLVNDQNYNYLKNIIIMNRSKDMIFNKVDTAKTSLFINDAIEILKGDERITVVTNYISDKNKYIVATSFPKNINWVVIAVEDYHRAYSLVFEFENSILIWTIVGIIIAILFGLYIGKVIRAPINNLADRAKDIANGEFDIEVDYKLEDSIGFLGSTMKDMAQSLKKNFLQIEDQKKQLEEYNKTLEEKVRDRTRDLEESNIKLNVAYKQVLELNDEKNEFMGIAAHDLKNPLTSIKGFGQIIQEDSELSKDEVNEFANIIVDSSERMFDIITNLLDINKIEEGRIEIKPDYSFLNEIVDNIVRQNIEAATKKDIEINYKKIESDDSVYTDKNLVMQVLDNLISNAVKYSFKGQPIGINIYKNEDFFFVSVEDNGPGLTEDDKKKLFQKFSKLSAKPTAGENSTGLGLSIAKKITELLGGDIIVESEVGKGSKFILKLPVKVIIDKQS